MKKEKLSFINIWRHYKTSIESCKEIFLKKKVLTKDQIHYDTFFGIRFDLVFIDVISIGFWRTCKYVNKNGKRCLVFTFSILNIRFDFYLHGK